ncbi:type IV secretion system protein TraC [Flexistipes sp.]|uniref:type IV secretion system protein TraC n=1 Tax=Flexistipes sp. TaxID=3088135 RepID=UPI002E20B776|nr:type IV secretion system protein TraC [Flexistipes sp.]
MGLAVKNIEAIMQRGRIADYLTPYGYEDGIYILRSGWGILFECNPIPYAGTSASNALESLFTAPRHSDDWYISLMLYASPNINRQVDEYYDRKANNKTNIDDEAIRELFAQRKDFYLKHTEKSFFDSFDLRVRDFRLYFSVIIPFKSLSGNTDVDNEIMSAKKALSSYKGTLESNGFGPVACPPERFIETMREILNIDVPENITYNPSKELREHVVYPSTKIKVQDNGDISINDKPHRVYSVKDFPAEMNLFEFGELFGSFTDNMKQIPTPFAVTLNLRLPNSMKAKERFQVKSHWTTQQADGNPVAKYMPTLWKRYQNFQTGMELYEEGKVQTPMQLSLWVQGDDDDHIEYLGQFIRTLWLQKNFTIIPENPETAFPVFLSTLPLQYDGYYEKFLKRAEPLFSNNAANMAPVSSDWKGGKNPYLTFVSRRGQLMNFDPYDTDGNYNISVVAESGKGKSFMTNEMVCSCLAEGGKVFIVDVGRSYEKLAEQIGGEFIEFDPELDIVINPFTKAKIGTDGNIASDEFELLVPLVGSMLGMSLYASQDEKDETKKLIAAHIEQAIRQAFREKQNETCWDDVIQILANKDDKKARDIATALFPFSKQGRYSKWVNGKDTFEYDKDFVVLELDTLEQKEDLKGIFLMMMIFRISQDIFMSYDRKKMMVIEEAWDLMRNSLSAAFIEKSFRRFRKHMASAVVVTQSIMDFFMNDTTRAIFTNSEWKMMLGQKNEIIEQAKSEKKLSLHDYFFELLKSVDTVKGKYSEVMISGAGGLGIGRLITDRYSYYLYTTDAEDKKKIKNVQNQLGCSVRDAINHIIRAEREA